MPQAVGPGEHHDGCTHLFTGTRAPLCLMVLSVLSFHTGQWGLISDFIELMKVRAE